MAEFSMSGQVEMAFFPDSPDSVHVRINGTRVEQLIAQMMDFPSDSEMDEALSRLSGRTIPLADAKVLRSPGTFRISFHREVEPDGPTV